jgi:DNA-binding transcriptional ArsR family regulator
MEDKITLDREAFKTLASKTRVDILKSLGRRRKMLAELSKQFGMSPSTIKEHMDNLSRAGLVVQIDDGHKWKYYELTKKGREIVNPTGSSIYVILALSLFAVLVTTWDLFKSSFYYAAPLASRTLGAGEELLEAGKDAIIEEAANAVPQAAPALAPALPVVHILGIALFTAIFGISLGYLIAKRMSPPNI